MPHRPKRKQKKSVRYVAGCEKLLGPKAEAFLKDQGLLHTMLAKRDRHLETVEDAEETVMISIGSLVSYNKTGYIAHIYHIDNFEDPDKNGWVVHLWFPGLVMGRHRAYKQYMNQMSADLGVDLWSVGV